MLQGSRRIGEFVKFRPRKLCDSQIEDEVVHRVVEGESNMCVRLGRMAGRQAGRQASRQASKLGEHPLSQDMLTRSISPLLSLTR